MRELWLNDRFIELHNPHKNPAECEAMVTQKERLARIMIDTGCDKMEWFRAALHVL